MSIEICNLEHIYGKGTPYEKKALYDINIKIDDGEFVGVIGHTGSGKSTLIKHLNGLLKPSLGTIYYDGEDIFAPLYSLRELKSKVGLVFQYPEDQLFESTVMEDVCFGPKNIGMDPLKTEMNAALALEQVGIGPELYDASPLELSGGQKRRVAIAGVLAMDPRVLILDEPTAGLDPEGREEILSLVTSLHDEKGITILLVSHSMEDVARYTDRLVVMNQGTVRYDGSPAEVFMHYKDLEKIGLAAPQVTYVIQKLIDKGVRVSPDIITVDQAVEAIMAEGKKKDK